MAHKEQLEFFSKIFSSFADLIQDSSFKGVVDLGSHDTSGGPHELLPKDIRYIGVDLKQGKNVNFVSPIELVDLPSLSFSISISSEVLEHNPFWRENLFQLCRLTCEGGIVIWTCAGIGRLEHGTTRSDSGVTAPFVVEIGREYYRNISAKDAENAFDHDLWFQKWGYFENFDTRDTYFVGLRKGCTSEILIKFNSLIDEMSKVYVTNNTLRSVLHSTKRQSLIDLYFKILDIKKRFKSFKKNKGKIRKIIRILTFR